MSAAQDTRIATSPEAVQTVLATERDAHARQTALVRASLLQCPAKSAATHRRWA
jgi:hypothetical protein